MLPLPLRHREGELPRSGRGFFLSFGASLCPQAQYLFFNACGVPMEMIFRDFCFGKKAPGMGPYEHNSSPALSSDCPQES